MQNRTKRWSAAAVVVTALALVAACTPAPVPGPGGIVGSYFQFRGTNVTVVNHNDSGLYGSQDEPYLYNIGFRVALNEPGSAEVQVSGGRGNAISSLGDGQSASLSGGQRAAVNVDSVDLLDVLDLTDPSRHLEIVGNWVWAMERDDVSVGQLVQDTADLLEDALSAFMSAGTLPSDPNDLIDLIIDVLFDDFFNSLGVLLGALFQSIPGITDDTVGSRMYIGIGATGTFSTILDAALTAVPPIGPIEIPIVTIPPDIVEVVPYSLGHNNYFDNQAMTGGGRHDYNLEMINVGQPNLPPTNQWSSDVQSGPAPLTVNFTDYSFDPDGTIASRVWDFGDFTTGTGQSVSHTFTNPGVYKVELTVTDNDGASSVLGYGFTVAGAPVSAPTNLQKTGSGCCDTWADFSWTPVPGAGGYEVQMNPTLGCIAGGGIDGVAGQVYQGRFDPGGLCLGTQYDARIRAVANGLAGPWSGWIHFTL